MMVFLGFLVCALITAEIFLRIYCWKRHRKDFKDPYLKFYGKGAAFKDHPSILYVKKENLCGSYPSNSAGFSSKREFSKKKPPNTIRIYCAGDSTTEQFNAQEGPDSSWPGKLQDILQSRFPAVNIEVMNAGVAGYSTAESLADFIYRGKEYQPDILLVYHNVNDTVCCQMVDGFKSDYSHTRCNNFRKQNFLLRWVEIPYLWTYQFLAMRILDKLGVTPTLIQCISKALPWKLTETLTPEIFQVFKRNITDIIEAALAQSCVPVLIKWECNWQVKPNIPHFLASQERVIETYFQIIGANNKALKEAAEERPGCHYIEVGPFDQRHFYHSAHFRPEGLKEMASRVALEIEPILLSAAEKWKQTEEAILLRKGSL